MDGNEERVSALTTGAVLMARLSLTHGAEGATSYTEN